MSLSATASRAEAFLFVEGGSLSKKKLAQLLECTPQELHSALEELSLSLQDRGITLIETDTEAALAVSPGARDSVQKAFERELGREIGDAGLEVLAILLYRGPSTRAQVDYIRGVNSSSTMRTLLARGLVERTGNPDDAREYLYRPTVELLAHMGASSAQELPDYATIAGELAAFESTKNETGPFDHENEPDGNPGDA
jgi:segregation and condensation protein B